MALYHSDIVDIDLESGTVHRSFAQRIIGEGDGNANRYGVHLLRNGEPVDIAGSTCMGYFIRSNGLDTVVINGGTFNGSKAYVTLPASCYAYDGGFTLVIKLVGGGVTGTMRIIDGTVVDSMIGAPVDPGSVIPDLSALMAVISRAEDAAGTISEIEIYAEELADDNYQIVINTGGGT